MLAFTRTCACGRRFRALDPFRTRCDACRARLRQDEFVPLASVDEGMREFYGDLLEQEGIPAILKTTSLARYAASPVIDIWVRLRDLEAAKQVIEPAFGDERPAHAEKRPG